MTELLCYDLSNIPVRSALVISVCKVSKLGFQIPEPLLRFTSECPLKVRISQGLGPSFQMELFNTGREDSDLQQQQVDPWRLQQGVRLLITACREETKAQSSLLLTGPYHSGSTTLANHQMEISKIDDGTLEDRYRGPGPGVVG